MEMYPWRGASRSGKNCWGIRGSSFNVGFPMCFFSWVGEYISFAKRRLAWEGIPVFGGVLLVFSFSLSFWRGMVWCSSSEEFRRGNHSAESRQKELFAEQSTLEPGIVLYTRRVGLRLEYPPSREGLSLDDP